MNTSKTLDSKIQEKIDFLIENTPNDLFWCICQYNTGYSFIITNGNATKTEFSKTNSYNIQTLNLTNLTKSYLIDQVDYTYLDRDGEYQIGDVVQCEKLVSNTLLRSTLHKSIEDLLRKNIFEVGDTVYDMLGILTLYKTNIQKSTEISYE